MAESSTPSPAFQDRLRFAREARKLTQAELAEKSGLQPSAVSHFETGGRSPSFDNLKRLADALDVSTDYLLGRVDEIKASGPVSQQIFRHMGSMSTSDQESLAMMAKMLAAKNKGKTKG
jgi:transcriptional regulator with XRE-family HTH domain